eukprot:4761998-Prymnesium_polylepis.1
MDAIRSCVFACATWVSPPQSPVGQPTSIPVPPIAAGQLLPLLPLRQLLRAHVGVLELGVRRHEGLLLLCTRRLVLLRVNQLVDGHQPAVLAPRLVLG